MFHRLNTRLLSILPSFLPLRAGGGEGAGKNRNNNGREAVFLNIRGPTAGCFCLPACINLGAPLAAVPAQGASQHLELKSRGEEGTGGC